jgi:alkanesulfonate monooxygenase SsuD/methylene tetrahydromethanopterin reductase-like flavin-dependent oxidoreductase (luciferase family)
MKKIGFLSFGHWNASRQSTTRSARDVLQQSIELAVAAEELGADGAYFRVHHFAQQLAWAGAGHTRQPRVSVSRSIFALMNDRDRAYFGRDESSDQIGVIDNMRAVFGRSYAAEPDVLIQELKAGEAIAEGDTLLLTVPNTLGVDYNVHVIESMLTHVAPALGWR